MSKRDVIRNVIEQMRAQNALLVSLLEILETEEPVPVRAAPEPKESGKDIMTVPEAAEFSGYSRGYMYTLINENQIAYSKPRNGKVFIKRADLVRFLTENRRLAADEISERADALLNAKGANRDV